MKSEESGKIRVVSKVLVALFVVMSLCADYFRIAGVPPRLVALMLLVVLYFVKDRTIPVSRALLTIIGCYIFVWAWGLYRSCANGEVLSDIVYKFTVMLIYPTIALGVLYGLIKKDLVTARFLIYSVLCVMGISSFVAVGQGLGIELLWDIRIWFNQFMASDVEPKMFNMVVDHRNVAGLCLWEIPLGNQLTYAFIILIFGFGKKLVGMRDLVIFGVILLCASYFSRSRSTVLAILTMLGLYSVFVHDRFTLLKRLGFVCFAVILAVACIWLVNNSLPYESDLNTNIRVIAWSMGVCVACKNLLGIGFSNYFEHAREYLPLIETWKNSHYALRIKPHNLIINCAVFYGLPGLMAMLVYVRETFRSISVKREVLLVAVAWVGYAVQGAFHNNFMFYDDHYHIFFVVLLLAEGDAFDLMGCIGRQSDPHSQGEICDAE